MKYDSVTGLAKEVNAIQKDFESMCSGLDALIQSLDGQWQGSAQKEFMTAYKRVKSKLKTVSITLERYTFSINSVPTSELKADKQSSLTFTPF